MNAESNSLLVVDDEELNREGLARHLRRHGFTVAVAKDGTEAIEVLGDRPFDLVLLDVMMPGMSGLEVLKFLRRIDSLLDLPIIMVTARRETEDVVEALELGANDYVTKPLDVPVVLARVRTQLALRRAAAQVTELRQKLFAATKELNDLTAQSTAASDRVRRDLEAAAQVQQALLGACPPQVGGVRFARVQRPCGLLAADAAGPIRLGEHHLGLYLLDNTGSGPAGALLAVSVSHLLARLALPALAAGPVPPAQVVAVVRAQLAAVRPFTLLYGVLDLDAREFRFAAAGHPGPIHLPHGAPAGVILTTDPPVGVGKGDHPEHALRLGPGDRLVLYSDGLTGARNAEGQHFGVGRLLAALEGTRQAPLMESLDAAVKDADLWRGDVPCHDDLSLLAVEMAG